MDAIPLAIARLEGHNKTLAQVFNTHFGVGAVVGKTIAPAPYKWFFIQVCNAYYPRPTTLAYCHSRLVLRNQYFRRLQ
jgi:hypothetical protein